jgi:hypothetical protein
VEVDAEGRPLPWVPPRYQTQSLGIADDDGHDAVLLATGALPIEPEPTPEFQGPSSISSDDIRDWFTRLTALTPFKTVPLTIARGSIHKHGFVTGRVWFGADLVPRRVHVTTCPNSDWAEILGCLLHELAHPISCTHGHGEEFKRTLVELAERQWGTRWFAEARARLNESEQSLGYWVASGIRAALRSGDPPVARAGDDGQLARVVTKVRKLRELALDQMGLPEGITATGTANDLVTTYGLGDYRIRIDAGIDDQMVDRWVLLEDISVWRRDLAHAIATYCDVFSLHRTGQARMHFFGKYADVVSAEYLYSICAAQIDRECERHLDQWKRTRDYLWPGDTRRERTSFCDSAAEAFGEKLKRIAGEELGASRTGEKRDKSAAHAAAEEFAREEHAKRGTAWTSGAGKHRVRNDAGRKVGGALQVVRGMASGGGDRRMLPGRS